MELSGGGWSWMELGEGGWSWVELGARFNNTPFILFCSKFYPISFFFIFEILSIMLEARKLDKDELEPYSYYFSCAQVLIFIIHLTAFTAFKICRKLNSACCNYVNFPDQSSFLFFKKFLFLPVYLAIIARIN